MKKPRNLCLLFSVLLRILVKTPLATHAFTKSKLLKNSVCYSISQLVKAPRNKYTVIAAYARCRQRTPPAACKEAQVRQRRLNLITLCGIKPLALQKPLLLLLLFLR